MRRGTLRRCPGAVAVAAALATVSGGCGAAHVSGPVKRPARATAAIYGGPAPLLVYFQRVVGVDPLASQLVVDTDGSAVATITLGGVNGQKRDAFTIDALRMRALRALIAHTPLSDTACCNDPGYYLYWISLGGRRTWRLEQRRVPRASRRLIDTLNAITDAHTHF